MITPNSDELRDLRRQIGTANFDEKRRYLPYRKNCRSFQKSGMAKKKFNEEKILFSFTLLIRLS